MVELSVGLVILRLNPGSGDIDFQSDIELVIPRKITGFKSRIFSGFMIEEILMKTSRFSEPQILAILRQAEGGVPVPELCRDTG